MTFETNLLGLFNNMYRLIRVQPLVLGGYTGWSGGQGGPPGGYVGYLPQTRVAYDTDEFATLLTTGSGTLLDNLNHIRARLGVIEASGDYGITVQENNVEIAEGIHVVSFDNYFEVNSVSADKVSISLLASGVRSDTWYSGVFAEDLSGQVTGAETHFTVANVIDDNSLQLYLNGVRKLANTFTVDPDGTGFTTDFTPAGGNTLIADYEVAMAGFLHTHSQYALATGILTLDQALLLLANKANLTHTHTESDITDLGTINQQIIFTIAGSGSFSVGTKPLRIYAHDVNTEATISEILVAFNTPPAGEFRVNVLKNGSTIFSAPTYVSVASGAYTGYRTTAFLNDNFVKDDYFQIAIVQASAGASDMTVHIRFNYDI
jgi:hypothetical protein